MNRSFLQHYLETSGMEVSQAQALAQILGQTVTREDIAVMDARLQAMDQRVDARLQAMDERLDARLGAIQKHLDTRLQAMEQSFQRTLDSSLHQIRLEMAEIEKRLLWRFVALLGGFAAVVTALEQLLG